MHWFAIATALALTLTGLLYMLVCGLIANKMTRPRRVDPLRNPVWNEHLANRVNFPSRGDRVSLSGWYVPAHEARQAIIFIHGKDCCRGEELNTCTYDLMKSLTSRGISVLMMDLRGHGESDKARMTYGLRERRDVLGALDWLLARGYEPAQVGIFGASMGGACALGALVQARAQNVRIGALVIDSTYANLLDMFRLKFRSQTGLPQFFLPGALWLGNTSMRVRLDTIAPERDAAQLTDLPMLVIHADGDQSVPVEHANRLADCGKATLWVTHSKRHMSSFQADPDIYVEKVTLFFVQHLGKIPMRQVA